MELFTRLVLDGVGVRLQPLHVALQDRILALKIEHLAIELLGFLALLFVNDQAIGTKDNMVSNGDGQSCRSNRCRFSPANGHAIQRSRNMRWQEQMRSAAGGECHSSKFGRGELRVNGTGAMVRARNQVCHIPTLAAARSATRVGPKPVPAHCAGAWYSEQARKHMLNAVPLRVTTPRNLSALATTQPGRMFLAFSASVFMAVCAHVTVPLFFTPVPVTLQTFAVLLIGLLLGPSLGFSSMVLYLAEGAVGMPVFSPAGPGGFAHLFGATGGYLMAYPFAAALAGFIVRAFGVRRSRFGAALVAGSAATVVILLMGGLWITSTAHATLRTTAAIGVAPFVPGEVIKIIAAAGAFASLGRYARH